jgi:hypothetical protein
MDDLTEQELSAKRENPRFDRAYASRLRPGDILEVHEDGWWDWVMRTNPKNRMQHCFAVVRVSGETPQKYLEKSNNSSTDEEVSVRLNKRRFQIENAYTVGEVTEVAAKDLRIHDKANLTTREGVVWLHSLQQ